MHDPQAPGDAGRPPDPAGAPPWGPPAASPPTAPPAPTATAVRPGPGDDGDRPPPRPASLLSAGAGILLVSSLVLFLGEIDGENQRIGGIVVSLLFQAIGVGLLLLARDQRSANAGVALSAVAVIPLLVYLFVDVRNPENTIGDVTDFTNTATIILLAAATLWSVAYFFGPGRRYGFFLGAALVAVWLVAVVQVVDDPLQELADPFAATTTFEPIGPGFGDDVGGPSFDGTGGSFDDPFFDPPSGGGEPTNPSATLGWVSLVFGGVYLAAAGWRDRSGDRRQATVLFAVAIPVLTLAVSFLSEPLDTEGAAIVAIALGVAGVWLGTTTGRRFTSWYGTFAAVIGVLVLVDRALEDSDRAIAAVLLVIGVLLAAAAARFGAAPSPLRPDGPGGSGGSGGSGGPGTTAQAAPWPPATPPWGGGPPLGGPPPGAHAPPPGATPWTPPGAGPPSPPPPSPPPPSPPPTAPPGAGPGPAPEPEPEPGSPAVPPDDDPWAPPAVGDPDPSAGPR